MSDTGRPPDGGWPRLLTRRRRQRPVTFPDIEPHLRRAVVDALRTAWHRLAPVLAVLPDEERVTALVEAELEALRGEGSGAFSHAFFESVVRGGKTVTLAGDSVEKAPDLRFVPREGPIGRALHAECKLVDDAHPVSRYVRQGIERFVCGQYACDMPSALMVAYCTPRHSVPETLHPFLEQRRGDARIATLALPTPDDAPPPPQQPCYRSRHDRACVDTDDRSPGAITLFHVWLQTCWVRPAG